MKSKIYNWTFLLLFIGISFLSHTVLAQTDREILVDLVKEEQEAVNAIVLYPEETRNAILKASLYPDALIKLESIQSKTRKSFIELIEGYPQDVQEEVWDLSRYPDLINTLVITPESDIDEALEEYPQVIHKRAKKAVSKNYELLNRVDELDFIAESAYGSLIEEYPEDTQNALNHLIGQPEVLTILMDNIRLTVLVGKMYEKDPEWLLNKADSLHLKLAKDNAKELDDWKQSLEEDPESAKQLQEVSEQYKEENNYYDDDYYEYDRRDRDITVNYYYDYHYPYWFGYPSWYSYPRWRVYPRWYDWGYYYGPHNRIIVLGMPSYHFTFWYFDRPHHHHHYNHLSTHFANHYYGHRNSTGSVTASVSQWRVKNREVVSERWIKDDGELKNRFEEFGRAEVQRAEYNRENPGNLVSQREFISKNERKFPTLNESVKQVKNERIDIRKTSKKTQTTKTQTRPIRTIPRKTKTKTKIESTIPKKDNRRKPNVSTRDVIKPKTRTIPTTKKAKDYHKSTWEKTTTKRTKIKQPRPTVRKKPVVKKPTTKRIPVKKKSKGN